MHHNAFGSRSPLRELERSPDPLPRDGQLCNLQGVQTGAYSRLWKRMERRGERGGDGRKGGKGRRRRWWCLSNVGSGSTPLLLDVLGLNCTILIFYLDLALELPILAFFCLRTSGIKKNNVATHWPNIFSSRSFVGQFLQDKLCRTFHLSSPTQHISSIAIPFSFVH